MSAREATAAALMLAGLFFTVVACVGVLRLPDFYTRLHAQSKCDTLGAALMLAGAALLEGFTLVGVKTALIVVFIALTSPLAAHALGRAALRSGLKPWTNGEAER